MKAIILVAGLLATSVASAAQFQFYPEWQTNRANVRVSTDLNPYAGEEFTYPQHICYYGAQADAQPLMEAMIAQSNFEAPVLELQEFAWTTSPKFKKPVIRFVIQNLQTGTKYIAKSIPQCVRELQQPSLED